MNKFDTVINLITVKKIFQETFISNNIQDLKAKPASTSRVFLIAPPLKYLNHFLSYGLKVSTQYRIQVNNTAYTNKYIISLT